MILNDLNISTKEACIFGDRLNTDILAGNRAGITTVLVLTGVTTRKELEELKKKNKKLENVDENLIPNLVFNSLDEVFKN
jgi:ribonucleotide monophosphatase NagD (HAD superfamily)